MSSTRSRSRSWGVRHARFHGAVSGKPPAAAVGEPLSKSFDQLGIRLAAGDYRGHNAAAPRMKNAQEWFICRLMSRRRSRNRESAAGSRRWRRRRPPQCAFIGHQRYTVAFPTPASAAMASMVRSAKPVFCSSFSVLRRVPDENVRSAAGPDGVCCQLAHPPAFVQKMPFPR